MERAAANMRGRFFRASMETVSIAFVRGATDDAASAAMAGPQATVERVELRLDEELPGLAVERPSLWPIIAFDVEVPLVEDLAPIGKPCRIEVNLYVRAFGHVMMQLCFSRPPRIEALEELRQRLVGIIEDAAVPVLH